MLSIHLTPADVARVRFAPGPDLLLDTMLAARALRGVALPGPLRGWRREVGKQIDAPMRPLFQLVSVDGFPDFLTPPNPSGLAAGIQTIVDTPTEELARELEPRGEALTAWSRRLLVGDRRARVELGQAVRRFHDRAVRSAAPQLGRWFETARSHGVSALAADGVAGMLGVLHPDITWHSGVLRSVGARHDGTVVDLRLDGQGLDLYPTPLTTEALVSAVPGRPALLVVPSAHLLPDHRVEPRPEQREDDRLGALADLLGRTRAELLLSVAVPGSTTQLARRLGLAVSSVSEHAGVLRRAGLVVSHRRAGAVLHTLSELGRRLVADEYDRRLGAQATGS